MAAKKYVPISETDYQNYIKLVDELPRIKGINRDLLAALEEIDMYAKVKTAADTNAKTIWAIRKMARAAFAKATKDEG